MDSKRDLKSFRDTVIRQKTVIKTMQQLNDSLHKALEEEKQYKNHAYYFILEKGHYYDYLQYSRENEI